MTVQPVTRSNASAATQVPIFTWNALANGDTGQGISIVDFPDKTITFSGTFGAGGSVSLEGSNDSTNGQNGNWLVLKDPSGSALTKTAAGIAAVVEHPLWIRPHCTGGDGTTAIVASILVRRSSR